MTLSKPAWKHDVSLMNVVITDRCCGLWGGQSFTVGRAKEEGASKTEGWKRRRKGRKRDVDSVNNWIGDFNISTLCVPPPCPTFSLVWHTQWIGSSLPASLFTLNISLKPLSPAHPRLVWHSVFWCLQQCLSSLLKIKSELAHYQESFVQINSQTHANEQQEISGFWLYCHYRHVKM